EHVVAVRGRTRVEVRLPRVGQVGAAHLAEPPVRVPPLLGLVVRHGGLEVGVERGEVHAVAEDEHGGHDREPQQEPTTADARRPTRPGGCLPRFLATSCCLALLGRFAGAQLAPLVAGAPLAHRPPPPSTVEGSLGLAIGASAETATARAVPRRSRSRGRAPARAHEKTSHNNSAPAPSAHGHTRSRVDSTSPRPSAARASKSMPATRSAVGPGPSRCTYGTPSWAAIARRLASSIRETAGGSPSW